MSRKVYGDFTLEDIKNSIKSSFVLSNYVMSASVTIPGDRFITKGMVVNIFTGDEKFDGPYYITNVVHRVNSAGYTTEFLGICNVDPITGFVLKSDELIKTLDSIKWEDEKGNKKPPDADYYINIVPPFKGEMESGENVSEESAKEILLTGKRSF